MIEILEGLTLIGVILGGTCLFMSLAEKSFIIFMFSLVFFSVMALSILIVEYQDEVTARKITESQEYKVHKVEGQPVIIVDDEPVKLLGFHAKWKSVCIDKYEDIDDDWFSFETEEVYRKPGETVPKPNWLPVNDTVSQNEYFNWSWNEKEKRWTDRSSYEQEYPLDEN